MSEVGERMKGGAVKEDKSPENEAILIDVQGAERDGGSVGTVEGSGEGSSARFQEGAPRSTLTCWDGLNARNEEVEDEMNQRLRQSRLDP